MKYILFLMFFTTAPGPENQVTDRVWTLQSTSTMEFASDLACKKVGASINQSLEKTYTVTVRGWCFCESTDPAKKCPAQIPSTALKFQFDLKALEKQLPEGSVGVQTLPPPAGK